jgi:hypothetical protein
MDINSLNPFFSDKNFYIQPGHFTVWNRWKVTTFDVKDTNRSFVVDQTTQDRYLDEPKWKIRCKCIALLVLGFPFHVLIAPIQVLKMVFNAINNPDERTSHSIARIVTAPFLLLGLGFSSLYGIFDPYDGRKLYASFERLYYHESLLAACFQPSSTHHQRKLLVQESQDAIPIQQNPAPA